MLTRAAARAAVAAIDRSTQRQASKLSHAASEGPTGRFKLGLMEQFGLKKEIVEANNSSVARKSTAIKRERPASSRATPKRKSPRKGRALSVKAEEVRSNRAVTKASTRVKKEVKQQAAFEQHAGVKTPRDFAAVYNIIRELRHPDGLHKPMRGAPVDEIGCSQAADAVFAATGEERNFHVRANVNRHSLTCLCLD